MKFLRLFIYSVFLQSIYLNSVFACTCPEGGVPTCAEFGRADAVLVGKVIKIVPFEKADGNVNLPSVNSISYFKGSGLVWLHIKVERAFKGVKDKVVKIATLQGTSCDIGRVKKGQRWIFFAYKNEESGQLGVGSCSATSQLSGHPSDYKEYFAELEELGQGKFGTFVKGTFVKDTFADERQPSSVSIEGDNFFSSTETGAAGDFSFRVPKSGKYRMRAIVPFSASFGFTFEHAGFTQNPPTETQTVFEYDVVAKEGECTYDQIEVYPIDLKATAELGGKYISTDSKPFSKFYPRLCPLKETEEETLKRCWMDSSLQMDGSFHIKGLREGKYTIVINDDNFPDGSSPFWRHYYPGVSSFKDLQPIVLEQGQKLNDLQFRLPTFLPVRELQGQVFWKDGSSINFPTEEANELSLSMFDEKPPYKMLFLDSFLTKWGGEQEKSIEMINVRKDGTFSLLGFDGFTYWLRANTSFFDKNTRCGFAKIKFDEATLQPLKIFLNRTNKCDIEVYIKEIQRKTLK